MERRDTLRTAMMLYSFFSLPLLDILNFSLLIFTRLQQTKSMWQKTVEWAQPIHDTFPALKGDVRESCEAVFSGHGPGPRVPPYW